jgi:hypothetical protein
MWIISPDPDAKAFRRGSCPVALRKPLTLDEKSAASASDLFAVHSRRLAGLLRLTIHSELFSYAVKSGFRQVRGRQVEVADNAVLRELQT